MTSVDFAACLSLSRRQPLYQLLSPLKSKQGQLQPTKSLPRPGLRSSHYSLFSPYSSFSSAPKAPSRPRSCFRRSGACLNKKRVVFADTKGLALTAVRLFIPEPSSPDSTLVMKAMPTKQQGQQSTANTTQQQQQQRYKLSLGFPQPMLDLKAFLARLREMCVQLQSCNISEQSLTGKVSVSHVSVEKTVNIKMTFDSWRSHHDIPCAFLQKSPFGGTDIDVFTFDLCLPKNIDPKERVEFCVCFSPVPGATPHMDDNKGQNYRVCMDKDGPNATQSDASRFYPSLSNQRPPSWPSPASVNKHNSAEMSYFERSLLYRLGAEGKSLSISK